MMLIGGLGFGTMLNNKNDIPNPNDIKHSKSDNIRNIANRPIQAKIR